ncbi:hypothetical protein [Geomonas edaphica]|uniref:hypothetical protein n=1 Tax=Geomonas edaphica TaxID=2570226 RepID=UPI0010A8B5B5|nr:hypothetical protein [Geomonas edaphica]
MKSSTETKLKGAQASPENKKRYAAEVAKMEALGEKFTTNQFGKVSVGAFASRCEFSRSVLENGALAGQFTADVARIGLATVDNLSRLRKKTDDKQKIANDLQKQLNLKTAEVEVLRKKVEELTKRVRELQLRDTDSIRSLEHMLATGERFFL